MAGVEPAKAAAIVTLTVMLCLTGVAFFIWSAATQWADLQGVTVAGIFICLGIVQAVFVTFWWRVTSVQKKTPEGSPKAPIELKLVEPTTRDNLMASPLLAPNGKDTPCSLRSDASSVPLGPRPFDVSGSIPYVDATSQSESSMA